VLARFRANPRKVRVGIRREDGGWVATVALRAGGRMFEARATGPRKAVVKALLMADASGMDGIDLGMGWTYEHPQTLPLSHEREDVQIGHA
jgi:hypothetical protein